MGVAHSIGGKAEQTDFEKDRREGSLFRPPCQDQSASAPTISCLSILPLRFKYPLRREADWLNMGPVTIFWPRLGTLIVNSTVA